MEGLVDDDLPPLLSDTEGSDGSDMPDLENSSSAGEEEPTEAPAAALQGGIHTTHQQQQHARHPHQRPMSEQRRMEAGINRNSRLWQVPDAGDSLAHSLGASPFDEEHGGGGSGMAGPSGMPVLQILPTISTDGSMMLTASLSVSPAGMTSTRAAAASAPNPLRNPTRFGAGGGSSSAAGGQRTEPLFVDGQQSSRRNGPASAFHGLAMPFLMGDSMASQGLTPGQFSFPGPAAAGAAAGAAGMTRVPTSGSTLRFVPLNNPRMPTPISAARSMPGVPPGGSSSSNASGAAAQAAAGGSRRSVIAGSMPQGVAGTPRDSISFFEAMGMGYGVGSSSQASSDSDGPFPGSFGPFRSGPRLRARRTRMAGSQQSAASAAAARAGRAASSAPGAPTYTFSSSTPPQAAAVAPLAAAAAAAAATGPAGAAGGEAVDVVLAQAGGNSSSSSSAGAPRGESSAASGEPPAAAAAAAAAAGEQQVSRPQGRRWWHPLRILTSGWSLISSVIFGALIRNSSSSSGNAGSTPGAAGAAAAPPASSDLFSAAGSTGAAGGAAFSLGLAAPGPSSRPGASRDRSSRARGAHHSASRTDSMDFIPCNGCPDRQREADGQQQQQQQQQPARTWTFPEVSPSAAAAAATTAAAPGTGGLSEAFSAARQLRAPAAQGLPVAAAPLSPASRPRSSRPQGKRQRHEEGDSDSSRPASTAEASPHAAAAPAAADGAGSSCMPALQSAGQAGSSATSPGVAGTAPSTQQLVATTARAVAAVAAGAAAAAAEEHDDSSDLPELLDTCPFADDTSSSAGSPPGLVAADMGSDGGLAGSSSNNMAGSSGTSSGPPSLASGSDAGSDDVDGLSLPGRAEWPAAGPAAAADEEDDGPPELVSGSDQEDSDEDDQIGAWFSYNAEHVQRQQQQRGTWEPAGLQAGQHSSGLRPGFLQGQALHEAHSINGIGQQQPPAAAAAAAAAPSSFYSMSDSYYNRARSIAAAVVPPPARPGASAAGPAAGADAEDDSGSEGSWETASDQDLEHAAAAGAAAPGAAGRAGRLHTGPSDEEPDLDPLTDDSCEDEDEDDYEDESDYEDDDEDEEEDEDEDEECDCPMCVSMRLINDDLALQRFAASGVATRAMAAAAGSATQAFGRPRSNAFAVPSGGGSRTTTGAVDSLCGDTDAPSSSAAARHPTGIPLLPPRGGKKGASGAGAGASGQQQQLPKDSITADASKARVDGLAVLLSDAAFTQQLLAGLPVSVEPGHSSIQSALEMIRGKSYMPINTVASHMLSGAATVADVQRTDAHIQAQRLLRQWNS